MPVYDLTAVQRRFRGATEILRHYRGDQLLWARPEISAGGTLTWTDHADSGDGPYDEFTFVGMDIGAPFAGRVVVAALYTGYQRAAEHAVVTIGGVVATRMAIAFPGATPPIDWNMEIWAAVVPTGATADIYVMSDADEYFGEFYHVGASVYVAPAMPTIVDTALTETMTGTTMTEAVDIAQGGALIGISGNAYIGEVAAWTGATEDVEDRTNSKYWAHADQLAAETGRVVSIEYGATWNVGTALWLVSLGF